MKLLLASTLVAMTAAFSAGIRRVAPVTVESHMAELKTCEAGDVGKEAPVGVVPVFLGDSLKINNMMGSDPSVDREIRFERCAVAFGKDIDLVIKADADYSTTVKKSETQVNRAKGKAMFAINLRAGTMSDFEFSFEDSDTHEAVELGKFYFSFLDIDGSADSSELLTVYGHTEAYITKTSELAVLDDTPEHVTLTSTTTGTGNDNPSLDPNRLTQQQQDRASSFVFEDTSSFKIGFEVSRSSVANWGRNLLFHMGWFPAICQSEDDKCAGWCEADAFPGATKCTWNQCEECGFCAEQELCHDWCTSDAEPWATKCTWDKCAGCGECEGTQLCQDWCEDDPTPWNRKCAWNNCGGCAERCVEQPLCKTWCEKDATPWNRKCAWWNCGGCDTCETQEVCKTWCGADENTWEEKCSWPTTCGGCDEC